MRSSLLLYYITNMIISSITKNPHIIHLPSRFWLFLSVERQVIVYSVYDLSFFPFWLFSFYLFYHTFSLRFFLSSFPFLFQNFSFLFLCDFHFLDYSFSSITPCYSLTWHSFFVYFLFFCVRKSILFSLFLVAFFLYCNFFYRDRLDIVSPQQPTTEQSEIPSSRKHDIFQW